MWWHSPPCLFQGVFSGVMIPAMHRIVIVSLLLTAPALPATSAADPIRVEQGKLTGAAGSSAEVRVYKGIPYAAPPVADLRWAPPKPAADWQGVRQAISFGHACLQTPYAKESLYYMDAEPMGEDCLNLNIWTAAKSNNEKRPVMVWIHGGALTRGSGSIPTYNGEMFAKKGVVLVTINYRLGVLGFFSHPELTAESEHKASGNYAVMDQIAALKWVQKNIAGFGGDPAKVTIFGESAGSWSVNYLTASPLAKGLFARAIGESGAAFAPMRTLAQAEQAGARMNPSLKALRQKPAEELIKGLVNTSPVVDGDTFPQDIYSIYAQGKQSDVPLIAGSNGDEATSLFAWPANGTPDTFITQARRAYGESADDFLKVYPATTAKDAEAAHYASLRDQTFGWQMRTWVRMQEKTGKSKAWLYQFTRIPPGPESARYRAYHASEIAYVFGNLDAPHPWESTDRELSSQMMSYWINFATRGDPNGKGLPAWPAYAEKSDQSITFGDKISVTSGLNRSALDFFDRYYERLRAAK
jgi:para-nitrobenzyl esterase